MRIKCHLSFDGQCEEAFRTYASLFGGEIVTLVRFGESPLANQVPANWAQRILHATLKLEGEEGLLGSDAFPDGYRCPQGFAATLSVRSAAHGRAMFAALAESGRVETPFQETFWSAGFGMLVDRFGIPWEINCEQSPASR
jgi:PhnB protein